MWLALTGISMKRATWLSMLTREHVLQSLSIVPMQYEGESAKHYQLLLASKIHCAYQLSMQPRALFRVLVPTLRHTGGTPLLPRPAQLLLTPPV